MNPTKIFLALALCFLAAGSAFAQNENGEKPKTPEEMASAETDRLVELYKLDDHQAFRVDTLLQRVYPLYQQELEKMRSVGASSVSSYQTVIDKWLEIIDNQYEIIFTPEQWQKYLKSGAGRERNKRAARLSAAKEGASVDLSSKKEKKKARK
ncbi:MAG: hypothetical protein HUJ91_07545 [Bacteroidales bacterium]|nr:hypothetical protein [Bacteroidales bacterium]